MLSILGHQRPFPDRYVSSGQKASALSRMFLNTYRLRDNGIRVAVLQLNAYRLPRPTEWEDRDFAERSGIRLTSCSWSLPSCPRAYPHVSCPPAATRVDPMAALSNE